MFLLISLTKDVKNDYGWVSNPCLKIETARDIQLFLRSLACQKTVFIISLNARFVNDVFISYSTRLYSRAVTRSSLEQEVQARGRTNFAQCCNGPPLLRCFFNKSCVARANAAKIGPANSLHASAIQRV